MQSLPAKNQCQWVEGKVSQNNHPSDEQSPAECSGNQAANSPVNSFSILLKDFASDTSFGGISKTTLSDGNIRRFCWLLISITCYTFTIKYCMDAVETYLKKPIKTSIDIKFAKHMYFPAVTVCNLNQFRKSKLPEVKLIRDILENYSNEGRNKSDNSSFEEAVDKLRKILISGLSRDNPDGNMDDVEVDEDVLIEKLVAITASFYNVTQLKEVGHQFNDTILSCSWNGANCLQGYFGTFWAKHWNWKYGNCFTFNPGVNEFGQKLTLLRSGETGPHHGLSIDINIEQTGEYVEELTSEAGALITVHEPTQMPFPYDRGITVSPGFSTSIAVRKETIIRVDPHNNGSCKGLTKLARDNIFNSFMAGLYTRYSVQACMESCLARAQYENCGCSDAKYASFVGGVCYSLEELECMNSVISNFKKDKFGCEEKCPPPCEQHSFLASINIAALSSKEKETKKEKNFAGNNETGFVFDDNFLRVKIFFDEFNLEKIVQSTYYDLSSCIADIGGQLGLWIGISIISVAEFGELLINLCVVAVQKYQEKRKSRTAVMELQQ